VALKGPLRHAHLMCTDPIITNMQELCLDNLEYHIEDWLDDFGHLAEDGAPRIRQIIVTVLKQLDRMPYYNEGK